MNYAEYRAECDRLAAEGLELAIADAGNRNRLALLVGVQRPTLTDWRAVPLVHLKTLCREFNKPPTRYRPDLFAAPRLIRELAK